MKQDASKDEIFVQKFVNVPILSDINIVEYGWRSGFVGHKYEKKLRNCFFFTLIKEGTGKLYCNGASYNISPGTLIVLLENRDDIYYELNPGTHNSVAWIGVYGSTIRYYLDKLGVSGNKPYIYLSNKDAVEAAMDEILMLEDNKTLAVKMAYISKLYNFISTLFDELALYDKRGYVEQGMEYMCAMFSTGITTCEVARVVGVDRSYFSMLFKKIVGMTPTEYLKNLRIKRAIELLLETDMSVTDISCAVGIKDENYFSRIFSRTVGMSPAQYRKTKATKER